ncbi:MULTISPECIES: hypothetical protein [Streptomyces]|uniref:Uncharacterized protein n=1 Tax=Streptomyces viridochromogenes TaxID=1938 RepID=A0A0L8LC96_STRVR|nr:MULTISPECIES: hypothetical protein [Streptomyces]KOG35636.1 hypothetical protein ADK34_04765 [Streptomyces viridochromogenes]
MENQLVRTGQTVLAVSAVLSVIPVLAFALPTMLGGMFLLTAMPVAIPLFLRREPQSFAWASLIIGTGLLAWAVVGLLIGMFFFIPAAVLLTTAAFVDPRTRPGALGVIAALGVPVAAGVLFYGVIGA